MDLSQHRGVKFITRVFAVCKLSTNDVHFVHFMVPKYLTQLYNDIIRLFLLSNLFEKLNNINYLVTINNLQIHATGTNNFAQISVMHPECATYTGTFTLIKVYALTF